MESLLKRILINKPSITKTEISYVNDAIKNGWGERCYDYLYKFEAKFSKYLDVKHSLATSSCTGAIHLALMAMGVKAGDEVIVPELTWIASVEPILYIGAKPVFVDVDPESWCIDPQKMEAAITSKTKAVIVVHLYGNLCAMDQIMEIASRHNLLVLEDAAEGLGSEFNSKKTGSIGHASVFSFHGTKTLSTGEGGILMTNDTALYKKAKVLNDHGRNPDDPENKMFWMRDYGYKYKMSNLQAAMGVAQIERIETLVSKKRQIFNWYTTFLKGLDCATNPEPENTKNSYWLPTIVFGENINFDRKAFFAFMKDRNIDTRPFFYPLSSLPMFKKVESNTISYNISSRGINLPSYHDLTKNDVKRICDGILTFINLSNGK